MYFFRPRKIWLASFEATLKLLWWPNKGSWSFTQTKWNCCQSGRVFHIDSWIQSKSSSSFDKSHGSSSTIQVWIILIVFFFLTIRFTPKALEAPSKPWSRIKTGCQLISKTYLFFFPKIKNQIFYLCICSNWICNLDWKFFAWTGICISQLTHSNTRKNCFSSFGNQSGSHYITLLFPLSCVYCYLIVTNSNPVDWLHILKETWAEQWQ